MDEITQILEEIGLTKQESRVYLALLELQEARTGILCKTTSIASSNIYKVLESLIKKGLVSFRVQNNIKVYMPSPPETLNELFLAKQKKLEQERKKVTKLITTLKKREIPLTPQSHYKYYEQMNGIKSMWYEINSLMENNSIIKIHTAKKESYQLFVGFYTEHHNLRKKKNIKEQLIFPIEDKQLAEKRKDNLTEIRFLPLTNDAEWGIVKDSFFIHYITGKVPRGFLIYDPVFARTFEQVFDRLWEISSQYP